MSTEETCKECKGETLKFWSNGVRSELWLCSRWEKPGHLTPDEIQQRFNDINKAVRERLRKRFP